MPLVAPHALIARAHKENWALGAFNTSNLEMTQAIAWGLRAARAPGIIQTSEATIRYAGLVTIRDIIRDIAASVDVPIVLHLDHGKSLDTVRACIEAGYGSVMFDGSTLPLEENIARTKDVVAFAHTRGVCVEGEVGQILRTDGPRAGAVASAEQGLTDPAEAERFVRETTVDLLAVAVGTLHGSFQGKEGIRFARLADIAQAVSVPLVLHGASGVPDAEILRALNYGIVKVNIDTELREVFRDTLAVHDASAKEGGADPRTILAPVRDAVQRAVQEKVKLLRSAGTA